MMAAPPDAPASCAHTDDALTATRLPERAAIAANLNTRFINRVPITKQNLAREKNSSLFQYLLEKRKMTIK
jgi:hypothetical protein